MIVFAAALAITNSNVEAGMNDDWSFVRTVHDLALSGHLTYNGWSAPLIGFQAWWGALFVRVFGFSFLVVRASSWVLTLAGIPVLERLLRRVGASRGQAFFGVCTFLLSPLILPNLATFMTDMPAFLLFAAALLTALKAWESEALKWPLATAVLSMLSGSVRQIYWLAGVSFLVVLFFAKLRSRRARLVIASCIGLIAVFGAWCSLWLQRQPYVPADITALAWRQTSWTVIANFSLDDVIRDLVGLSVLCLPFTLPFWWLKKRPIRMWAEVSILLVSAALPLLFGQPAPWLGNTITGDGVTLSGTLSLGEKPAVMSHHGMLLLALLGAASSAQAGYEIALRLRRRRLIELLTSSGLGRMAALTIPFSAGYLMVLAVRAPAFGLYDRYMIPLLFIGIAACLGVCARLKPRVSSVSLAAGAIFALYAIATTHDYFADARAKLEATDRILATGAPREAIISGFEFDLWTQTEKTGHINNKLVQYPAGAYRQMEDCNGDDDVDAWWRPMAPALRAHYVVSLSPFTSLRPVFAPVVYQRWVPFGKGRVYVGKVGDGEPLLTCGPESGE